MSYQQCQILMWKKNRNHTTANEVSAVDANGQNEHIWISPQMKAVARL